MTMLFPVGDIPVLFLLVIPMIILFLKGFGLKEKEPETLSWMEPIPRDLIERLNKFPAMEISKETKMNLDDVFNLIGGKKKKTAPEIIEMLYDAVKRMEDHDKELDREAERLAFIIKGMDTIEDKKTKKLLK